MSPIDLSEELRNALTSAKTAAELMQKRDVSIADLFPAVQALAASNQTLVRCIQEMRARAHERR